MKGSILIFLGLGLMFFSGFGFGGLYERHRLGEILKKEIAKSEDNAARSERYLAQSKALLESSREQLKSAFNQRRTIILPEEFKGITDNQVMVLDTMKNELRFFNNIKPSNGEMFVTVKIGEE